MPIGEPKDSKNCLHCREVFCRQASSQKFCSVKCKLFGNVDRSPGHGPDGDCWQWIGGTQKEYGYIHVNEKKRRAHIVSYELFKGQIPKEKQVNHTCHNSLCIKPDHLYAGTQQDNMQDLSLKCLSDIDVQWIRWLYPHVALQQKLARAFNVSRWMISKIVNGAIR